MIVPTKRGKVRHLFSFEIDNSKKLIFLQLESRAGLRFESL